MSWLTTLEVIAAVIGGVVLALDAKGGVLDKHLGSKWITTRRIIGALILVLAIPLGMGLVA